LQGIQMKGQIDSQLEAQKQKGKLTETVVKEASKAKEGGKERLLKIVLGGGKSAS